MKSQNFNAVKQNSYGEKDILVKKWNALSEYSTTAFQPIHIDYSNLNHRFNPFTLSNTEKGDLKHSSQSPRFPLLSYLNFHNCREALVRFKSPNLDPVPVDGSMHSTRYRCFFALSSLSNSPQSVGYHVVLRRALARLRCF